jgi:hypothetical protein
MHLIIVCKILATNLIFYCTCTYINTMLLKNEWPNLHQANLNSCVSCKLTKLRSSLCLLSRQCQCKVKKVSCKIVKKIMGQISKLVKHAYPAYFCIEKVYDIRFLQVFDKNLPRTFRVVQLWTIKKICSCFIHKSHFNQSVHCKLVFSSRR